MKFTLTGLSQYRAYDVLVDDKLCFRRSDMSTDPKRVEQIKCTSEVRGTNVVISIPSQESSKAKDPPELSICEVAIFGKVSSFFTKTRIR